MQRNFLGQALTGLLLTGAVSAQIFVSPTGSDVTGTGSQARPFKTISFAETQALPGQTLFLSAGVFGDDEQIVIGSKNIAIVGAGQGQTIIRPNPSLTFSLPRGFPNAPQLQPHRVAMIFTGSGCVEVRDLTIDGDFRMPSNGRLHGAFFRDGADGRFQNVEFTNCRANPLNGSQGPVGVVVRGDNAGDPCEVSFDECLIQEFGKGGIVSFFNSDVQVRQSSIRGAGAVDTGMPAQIGVQISYDSTGTVQFNDINGIRYIPTTYGAAGVLLYEQGANCSVDGNRISQCEIGIWSAQDAVTRVATRIQKNVITGTSGAPIAIENTDNVRVTDNVCQMVASDISPSVFDNSFGQNLWSGNNYSDYPNVGLYLVEGGGSIDFSPRNTCDEISTSTDFPVPGAPVELVAFDVDGNFGNDVVAVSDRLNGSLLSVGLNDGTGNLNVVNTSFGSAGGVPVGIVQGEFNNIPGTDVAVVTINRPAFAGENKVFVFGNVAGTLSLIHTETLGAGVTTPNDIAAGDLNGDGVDDLAIADLAGLVHTLTNGGTGTFWTTAVLPNVFTTAVRGVAIANIDGGTDLEVAATEGDGSTGLVHYWENNGTGTLTLNPASPITVANNPNAIAASDIDADGDDDLLVSSIGAGAPIDPGTLTVLNNDGAGALEVQETLTDRGPIAIATGDLGRDDDPNRIRRDAAVLTSTGTVKLLMSNDGNSFATGSQCPVGTTPRSIAIADLNGDDYDDLIFADAGAQSIHVVNTRATARVVTYGAGCPGNLGRVPNIFTAGSTPLPRPGNATFSVGLENARPFSPGVLNVAVLNGPALTQCNLLLAGIVGNWAVNTGPNGEALVNVAVPNAPSLAGANVYFQWLVVDGDGQFLGLISASQGLKVTVGR